MQDTNPMQAIAVSQIIIIFYSFTISKILFVCFLFLIKSDILFVCRTLRTPPSPSPSSDSSVSCVWWSCSIVQRASATCCGHSSSPSRSLRLSWPYFIIVSFSSLHHRELDCCGLCLQALPHVALLIVMLFFIYAVIGMQVQALSILSNQKT